MNRSPYPTKQSINATNFFSYWLCHQMAENDTNAVQLANYCDLERKTIYSYCSGERYPRLDTLVKIFSFFDCKKIEIPLEDMK